MDSGKPDVKSKQKRKRRRSLSFNSGSRTSMQSEVKRHSFRVSDQRVSSRYRQTSVDVGLMLIVHYYVKN